MEPAAKFSAVWDVAVVADRRRPTLRGLGAAIGRHRRKLSVKVVEGVDNPVRARGFPKMMRWIESHAGPNSLCRALSVVLQWKDSLPKKDYVVGFQEVTSWNPVDFAGA